MTERDPNRGTAFQPGSTYPSGGTQNIGMAPTDPRPASPGGVSGGVSPASPTDERAGTALKEKASEDWQAIKSSAQEQVGNVAQRATDAVGERKDYAAQRVGGIADAVRKVGEELEQGEQPEVGRYAKRIGSSLQHFADEMKGKDMGEIAAMAEDFGRRQPAAFLGLAAFAGFAASRFLTASAEPRRHSSRSSAPERSSQSTNTPMPSADPIAGSGYGASNSTEGKYNG